MQSDYRGNYNAQFDQVSLLFVLQQSVVDASLPESGVETMRIAAGNSALPEAMARDLGAAVRLDSPVTKIEQHSWGVRVHAGGMARGLAPRWMPPASCWRCHPRPSGRSRSTLRCHRRLRR